MKTLSIFEPDADEIDALVASHPLAQLVSLSAGSFIATPLPLLVERGPQKEITLLGHFARANPHVEALEACPEALAVFMGPQGYISPSWFTDRTQAPTWNFATVHMSVRVAIDRSPSAAREAVDRLTEHMERERPRAWSAGDMGERYERLLLHVVAFRAEVSEIRAKFKLGQNERPDVLADAVKGLGPEGNLPLLTAMRHANRRR